MSVADDDIQKPNQTQLNVFDDNQFY